MHFSSFFSTSQPLQYNYRGSSSSSSSDTSSSTSNNHNAIMKDSHQQQQQQSNKSKSTASLKELLTSKDWMGSYQENHVDIDLKKTNPFLTTSSNAIASTTTSTLPPPRDVPALKHDASSEQSTQQTTTSTTSNNNNKSSSSTTDWMGEYYQSLGAGSSEASAQASLKKSFPVPLLPRSRSSSLAKPLSRSSSRGTSTGVTNWGKPSSMDSFKMSVDFSAFMTPSMDAAMDQIHQEEEDTASKAATTNTNGNKHASSKDASVMILCGPSTAVKVEAAIPMDTTTTTTDQVTTTTTPAAAAAAAPPSLVDVAKIVALTEQTKAAQQRATAARPKPKKKKKARRNKEPDVKVFVDPSDTDVLLGRGGRSNHHKGNVAYRSEVGNLRDWYRTSEKNAKTDLSQLLVDWVHKEQAGRFLKLDTATNQWYIVTNIVARRKASQALREHMTREEREARKAQQQQGGGGK